MIAQSLRMDLKDAGCNVYDSLTTGEEAIEFVNGSKPDVILIDINSAGKIDGIDTAREITEKSDIPIIFTTGYEEPKVVERAKQIKPVAYLIKPVEFWDLKPIIDSIFD